MTRGRPKRWTVRIALALASATVAIGVAELGLRLRLPRDRLEPRDVHVDRENLRTWVQRHAKGQGLVAECHDPHPILGWVPKPMLRDATGVGLAPVSTNSGGMRGRREYDDEKPPGVTRVVLLGDSFTFGDDMPDDVIWPALLEDALPGSEVLNLGVSGYGTDQALLTFRERGRRYAPDVVVWTIFGGDLERSLRRFTFFAKPRFVLAADRLELTGTPVPTPEALLADPESFLGANGTRAPFSYALACVDAALASDGTDELLRVNRAIVAAAVEDVARAGARLVVVLYAGGYETEARALEAWSSELGFRLLDARRFWEHTEASPIHRMGHFSEAGHRAFALGLSEALGDGAG